MVKAFDIAFKGKFYPIFCFLFGIGAFLCFDNALKRDANPYKLFSKRLLFLMAIGFIHACFHPGEALLPYSILGFLLLFAFLLKPVFNLIISVLLFCGCFFIAPSFISIVSLFYLGFYFGQKKIFKSLLNYHKQMLRVFVVGAIASIFGNMYLKIGRAHV